MKTLPVVLAAALAAAGCTTTTSRTDPGGESDARARSESTPSERAGEEAVRRYFQSLGVWDIPAAYNLLSQMEKRSLTFEQYSKGLEAQRETVIKTAKQAQIASSGAASFANGAPYVMVVVKLGEGQVQPFRAVPEQGEWKVILADDKPLR